jgi:hypothetical protein
MLLNKMEKAVSHPRAVGLILQKVIVTVVTPELILEGVQIRPATDEEIERFKDVLGNSWLVEDYFEHSRYETEATGRFGMEPLPRNEWRYSVIEERGFGDTLHLIDLIANITDVPLDCSKLRLVDTNAIQFSPSRIANIVKGTHQSEPIYRLTTESLANLIYLYQTYNEILDKELQSEIFRALTLYDDLGNLPDFSPLVVIGLFAIIELILTHQPRLKDNYDAISHQLRTKITLMSHRFEGAMDYDIYFGNNSNKKVWDALYEYRSLVAHGSAVDFGTKELKLLKSADNANRFLRRVLRLLFVQYLKEPQLVADLKLC